MLSKTKKNKLKKKTKINKEKRKKRNRERSRERERERDRTIISEDKMKGEIYNFENAIIIISICHGNCSDQIITVPEQIELCKRNVAPIGETNTINSKMYVSTTTRKIEEHEEIQRQLDESIETKCCELDKCYPTALVAIQKINTSIEKLDSRIDEANINIDKNDVIDNTLEKQKWETIKYELEERKINLTRRLERSSEYCKYKIGIKKLINKVFDINSIIDSKGNKIYLSNYGFFLTLPMDRNKKYNLFLISDIEELLERVGFKRISLFFDYYSKILTKISVNFDDSSTKQIYKIITSQFIINLCTILQSSLSENPLKILWFDLSCFNFSKKLSESSITDMISKYNNEAILFFAGGKNKKSKKINRRLSLK
jgi:hypothetical protein